MKRYLNLVIFNILSLNTETQTLQGSFNISGVINDFPNGKAVLSFIQNNAERKITTNVKNGQFHFSGQLTEVEQVTINF